MQKTYKILRILEPGNRIVITFFFLFLYSGIFLGAKKSKILNRMNEKNIQSKTFDLTEDEWKAKLNEEQFRILRKAGTERPNGKVYQDFKKHGEGIYYCVGCNTELFSSKQKFDSHCGWPSFFDPSKIKNVKQSVDYLLGYPRTEVLCAVCDGHLGHVFKGEGFDTPTDKRYCINGTVLRFRAKLLSEDGNATNDSPEGFAGDK